MRRKTNAIAEVFPFVMGRLYPGTLTWYECSMVVATSRGAVPPQLWHRAAFIFRIERQLRLRSRLVQHRLGMPTALSVFSGALMLWRRFSAEPGFDTVTVREEEVSAFVDCLLAVTASRVLGMDSPESLWYEFNRLLIADLKVRHDMNLFDCIEEDLIMYWQAQADKGVDYRFRAM